jgi:hypothetical protein
VYIVHGTRQRMKLGTGLAAFLKLALKAVQDMVEGEAALAGLAHISAHTTDPSEALLLHGRTAGGRGLVARKGKPGAAVGGASLGMRRGNKGRILMLLGSCGGLGVFLREDADNAGGDFMVDDGLVIFAHDVDTKFLGERGRRVRCYCHRTWCGRADVRQCRQS